MRLNGIMAIRLSRRLETIVSFVPHGCVAVDVGCDHAHVPIRLLQDGIVSFAIGIDVAKGPLSIAATNLELAGLTERCRLILSDGLKEFNPDDITGSGLPGCLIIAGMGGILMRQILEDEPEKAEAFETFVLSPHSEVWAVREYLMDTGYEIRQEALIEEDGKYYPVILAGRRSEMQTGAFSDDASSDDGTCRSRRPDWDQLSRMAAHVADASAGHAAAMLSEPHFQRRAELEFGPCLLAEFDETLFHYIVKELRKSIGIHQTLSRNAAGSRNAALRASQVMEDIGVLQTVLFMYRWLQDQDTRPDKEVVHASE